VLDKCFLKQQAEPELQIEAGYKGELIFD
jgi:hypothetical protein